MKTSAAQKGQDAVSGKKKIKNANDEVTKKHESGQQSAQKAEKGSKGNNDFMVIKKLSEKERKACQPLVRSPIRKSINNFFSNFLYPMDPAEFMKNIYRKRAYAVINAEGLNRAADIVNEYMYGLNLPDLIENSASERIFVQFIADEEGRLDSFEVDKEDPKAAMLCHNAGRASLYFRSSQEMADMFVTHMSDKLGMNFAGLYADGQIKGEIEIFVSRKGHVTDWHFDYMENFTVQLKGSKTWKLMPSGITHPIRGCTPHFKGIDTVEQQQKVHRMQDPRFKFSPEDFDNVQEVTLTEGSCLYFPAGMWHRVECTEDSIQMNISLIGSSWADVVSNGIHQVLLQKEDWRQIISFQQPAEARKQLEGLLARLKQDISVLTVDDLLPASMMLPRRTYVDLDDNDKQNADMEVNPSTVFRRNPLAVLVDYHEPGEDDDGEHECDDPNCTLAEHCHSNGHGHGEEDSDADDENENEDDDESEDGMNGDSNDGDNASSCGSEGSHEHVLIPGDGTALFSLHINFGNEELESAVKTILKASPELLPSVEWVAVLKPAATFTAKQLHEVAKQKSDSGDIAFEKIARLLRLLSYNGLVNKVEDAQQQQQQQHHSGYTNNNSSVRKNKKRPAAASAVEEENGDNTVASSKPAKAAAQRADASAKTNSSNKKKKQGTNN